MIWWSQTETMYFQGAQPYLAMVMLLIGFGGAQKAQRLYEKCPTKRSVLFWKSCIISQVSSQTFVLEKQRFQRLITTSSALIRTTLFSFHAHPIDITSIQHPSSVQRIHVAFAHVPLTAWQEAFICRWNSTTKFGVGRCMLPHDVSLLDVFGIWRPAVGRKKISWGWWKVSELLSICAWMWLHRST
jgi:hypothetical protein